MLFYLFPYSIDCSLFPFYSILFFFGKSWRSVDAIVVGVPFAKKVRSDEMPKKTFVRRDALH